jgi:hypothetical protein
VGEPEVVGIFDLKLAGEERWVVEVEGEAIAALFLTETIGAVSEYL